MKTKHVLVLALALYGLFTVVDDVSAQGTAFTYQGRLNDSGSPASGNYDFTFALFNNSGTNSGQVGSTLTNLDVGVTNGLFTAALDFGANFPGASRWLAVGVRTNGSANFTGLSPLQELTPTPYAIYAPNAGTAATAATAATASTANSVSATNITGTIQPAQLNGANIDTPSLSTNLQMCLEIPENFNVASQAVPLMWFDSFMARGRHFTYQNAVSDYLTNQLLANNVRGWGYTGFLISDGLFTGQDAYGVLQFNTNINQNSVSNITNISILIHTNGFKLGQYIQIESNNTAMTSGGTWPLRLYGYANPLQVLYSNAVALCARGVDFVQLQPSYVDPPDVTLYYDVYFAQLLKQLSASTGHPITVYYDRNASEYQPDVYAKYFGGIQCVSNLIDPDGTYTNAWQQLNDQALMAGLISPGHVSFETHVATYGIYTGKGDYLDMDMCAMVSGTVCLGDMAFIGANTNTAYDNLDIIGIIEDPGVIMCHLLPNWSYYTNGAVYPNQVWLKPLGSLNSGNVAVLLANSDPTQSNTFNLTATNLGLNTTVSYSVRDCNNSTNIGMLFGNTISYLVGPTNFALLRFNIAAQYSSPMAASNLSGTIQPAQLNGATASNVTLSGNLPSFTFQTDATQQIYTLASFGSPGTGTYLCGCVMTRGDTNLWATPYSPLGYVTNFTMNDINPPKYVDIRQAGGGRNGTWTDLVCQITSVLGTNHVGLSAPCISPVTTASGAYDWDESAGVQLAINTVSSNGGGTILGSGLVMCFTVPQPDFGSVTNHHNSQFWYPDLGLVRNMAYPVFTTCVTFSGPNHLGFAQGLPNQALSGGNTFCLWSACTNEGIAVISDQDYAHAAYTNTTANVFFNSIEPAFQNMVVVAGPHMIGLDLRGAPGCYIDDCGIQAYFGYLNIIYSFDTNSWGVVMPAQDNAAMCVFQDSLITGFNSGLMMGELGQIRNPVITTCSNALNFDLGGGDASVVTGGSFAGCFNDVFNSGYPGGTKFVNVAFNGQEQSGGNLLYDPKNQLAGLIVCPSNGSWSVVGGANVDIENTPGSPAPPWRNRLNAGTVNADTVNAVTNTALVFNVGSISMSVYTGFELTGNSQGFGGDAEDIYEDITSPADLTLPISVWWGTNDNAGTTFQVAYNDGYGTYHAVGGGGFAGSATNYTLGITSQTWVQTNPMAGGVFITATNLAIFNSASNRLVGPITVTNQWEPMGVNWTLTNTAARFNFAAYP